MALLALSSDPKLPKPRGRVSVNGWDECLVNGRSLASLRSEMLREKKPSGPSSNPSSRQSKRADVLDVSEQSEPVCTIADDVTPADNAEVIPVDNAEVTADTKQASKELAEGPRKPAGQTEKQDSSGKDSKVSQLGPEAEQPSQKGESKENTPSSALPEGANPSKPGTNSTPDAALGPSGKIQVKSTAKDEGQSTKSQPQLKEEEKVNDEVVLQASSARMKSDDSPTKDYEVKPSFKAEPHHQSEGTHSKMGSGPEAWKPERKTELKSEAEPDSESHLATPDILEEKGNADAEMDSEDADAGLSKKEPSVDRNDHPAGEERESTSPSKNESRKRKRSECNESSPSDGNTPSRQNQERLTRRRTEWNKNGRKLEIPSVSEMDTEGLDAETIEAVAIAAQAEKDEANNRGRRTTRLAAGKIKQVDYKAAANTQGTRGYSPSNEDEDVENIHSNNSNVEPARSSRRRTGQNQAIAPQRSSRRVARMRSSQEKDQSSVEEQDLSSSGNGSESREEADPGASQNDINVEPASVSRMNGSKADGRDRKRSRSDGRKTRQQQADAIDFEGNERTNYGTRSSTRENSVIDMDDDDINVDQDERMEEDSEKRIDRHGWTIEQLTRIGNAVKVTKSIHDDSINAEVDWTEEWTSDGGTNKKVASYINSAVSFIADLRKELSQDQKEKEVTAGELCSFIATDVWRLKTGGLPSECPRKPISVLARVEREEMQKASLEKIRRKLQREVDDYRSKLDGELEIRRKLELDAAYVELQALEVTHFLPIEEARRRQLEKVVEQYRTLDGRLRTELDKTKILVSQLRGERESQDELPAIQKNSTVSHSPTAKPDDTENDDVLKDATQPLEESITDGEDVKMTHKEEASPSQRQQEMERLRDLIAAREAEAESLQRACEKERMKFTNFLDAKNRLEVELYMNKSHGIHGHGVSVASPLQTPSNSAPDKSKKDTSRKTDVRNNGTGTARNTGQAKGKSNNGKHSLGVNPTIAKVKTSASSNLKGVSGKNGESSKGMKKKSNGKPASSPAERQ